MGARSLPFSMRPTVRLVLLSLLVVAPGLLSGCLGGDSDKSNIDYQEGHGLVTIYVTRPIDADKYPLQQLLAVPRLVVFIAGSNETKMEQGQGYTDAAVGWTKDWLQPDQNGSTWPAAAEQNWLRNQGIWFQAQVPAGEYSVIRIEIIHTKVSYRTGGEATAYVQGDRLSADPGDGSDYFVVEEGKSMSIVLHSKMEEQGVDRYVIR